MLLGTSAVLRNLGFPVMVNVAVRTCTPCPMVGLVGRQCGCLPLLCPECNTIRSVSTCWISPWYCVDLNKNINSHFVKDF